MGLTKLQALLSPVDTRNADLRFGAASVVGLSTKKEIIRTKADLDGVSLTSYKLFPPHSFAYVPDTSRRGDMVSLAFNDTEETYLVSSISVVFEVRDKKELLSEYLFMYFNRPEFDRYARFNSWGSAREAFTWEDMCDIEIDLPPLPIQQKYVDIYTALQRNQRSYERGLDDLKLTCDACVDELKRTTPHEQIAEYIYQYDKRNQQGLTVDKVRGLSVSKEMISTKADMNGVSLSNYKLVPPGYIAYVPDTSRRGDKMSLAFNDTSDTFLVSAISSVFSTQRNSLLPEYLMLFFCRDEFDRYARFCSWGSARETFDWGEMQSIKIPLPPIDVQRSIVDIYRAYKTRKTLNERLKAQLRDICPILIKGSIEEASA